MKYFIIVLACTVGALLAPVASAQTAAAHEQKPAAETAPKLTRFDLNFGGGTPHELVAAITKASGKPLNAIVPTELASWKIPPLKMTSVTTQDLFAALERAGRPKSNGNRTAFVTGTFKTQDQPHSVRDTTVWYFYVVDFPRTQDTRYFLLSPYLDRGLTVDDITTAIQTGWKMRNLEDPPTLSFHRETKLLIAVGDSEVLQTIEMALKALDPAKQTSQPVPEKKS